MFYLYCPLVKSNKSDFSTRLMLNELYSPIKMGEEIDLERMATRIHKMFMPRGEKWAVTDIR